MKKNLFLLIINFQFLLCFSQNYNFDYAHQVGSTSEVINKKMLTRSSGIQIIAGIYSGSADFDPGSGVLMDTSNGDYDFFIQMYDATGNLIWHRSFGGFDWDEINAITADQFGNIYATGIFRNTVDFDPDTFNTFNLTANGNWDCFVLKLSSGGSFQWAKKLGGIAIDEGLSISILNQTNELYIGGTFEDTVDFNLGAPQDVHISTGGSDCFIVKMDNNGNFVWSEAFGGPNANEHSIIVKTVSTGDLFVFGNFLNSIDIDPSTSQTLTLNSNGGYDIFLFKLNNQGTLVWNGQIGGSNGNGEWIKSVNVDVNGSLILGGSFSDTVDFDPGIGIYNMIGYFSTDEAFVMKMDLNGNLLWAKHMGECCTDQVTGVVSDAANNTYCTGIFGGTVDFDPDSTTFYLTSPGFSTSSFFQKLSPTGSFITAGAFASNSGLFSSNSIGVDANKNIYLSGDFYNNVDFDPNTGIYNLNAGSTVDLFMVKLDNINSGLNNYNSSGINVNIFPNPVNDKLRIEMNGSSIGIQFEISNLLGEIIQKQFLFNQVTDIQFNHQPGIYFISLSNGNGKVVRKFVKQ